MRGEHPTSIRDVCAVSGIIPACAGSTLRARRRRAMWDHPRVRGEHTSSLRHNREWGGSSPRARGARASGRVYHPVAWIIPACAGSTRQGARSVQPTRDHPRVRGEHRKPLRCPACHMGSSPRARGAREVRAAGLPDGGIIPACAGSTLRARRRRRAMWDHPRVRGEHKFVRGDAELRRGSSPRARGAHSRIRAP